MNDLHNSTHGQQCVAIAFSILMLGLMPSIAQANWWRTPEQQASDALEAGNIEQLQNVAPDANWQAIAKHKNGEFEAAADDFSELATQSLLEGDIQAANRALYNQGVSDVRAGDFESALENFEQVLQSEPQFQDAAHNSEIVRQLIEQQQQQQQEQEPGEEGEEGDQQSSDSGEQQPSDQQPSDDEQSDEEQGEEGQSKEANEGSENSEPSDAEQAASEEQQEREAQAARDALDATDQPPPDGQPEPDDGSTGEPVELPIETMSESDQAIEQWLRRIPDDPAGLLRRKLEQSHLIEFPEVTDAVKPW